MKVTGTLRFCSLIPKSLSWLAETENEIEAFSKIPKSQRWTNELQNALTLRTRIPGGLKWESGYLRSTSRTMAELEVKLNL